MIKPSILTEETPTHEEQDEATQKYTLQDEGNQANMTQDGLPPSSAVVEAAAPAITLSTGETLQRRLDGSVSIGEWPIIRVTPHGLPTQVRCIVQCPDEGTNEYDIAANDLLLVSLEGSGIRREAEAQWFSAYTYAKSMLKGLTTVFSETAVGSALPYSWGGQDLLKAITQAEEVASLFPSQFPDAASLFAASVSLQEVITAITSSCEQRDIVPFLASVMGGQAFLEVFSQLQNARLQLPVIQQNTAPTLHGPDQAVNTSAIDQQNQVSIIRKEDEAERLHGEIVDNKNPLTQLFLAMILGATSFLAIVLQPNVAPFTACLLPLASLAIAFKIAAYDLRPGQINFYLRRVLLSPWEIIRRILFDGSQPSEQELTVLREQNIVITEALLQAATALKPPFPDMQSTANRLAILIFEGAAIGVLIVRGIDAIAQRDIASLAQALLALAISSIATFYSFKVLKRKRVR
ncbi:hypothetical protein KDA_75760 [Dictyobacter alpinus]|uniref:Uncharacterized protein n=1 Tax=Dictyobacter alpinus TaxID=2014873 RepID=A0A402BL85_9CHLR|nr:hypothetical protein [Dictyobacter alpinus]GCE32092.1 hypothetical protein KDA_75760 [Dictyobacter alpinus]